MLVVLAYCHKDWQLAIKNLRWIAELDGCQDSHSLLLIASNPCTPEQNSQVLAAGKSAFKNVTLCRQSVISEQSKEQSVDALFRAAADFIYNQKRGAFLWLEPDAFPVKAGWLSWIESEYEDASKRFMGSSPKTPQIGVYPQDAYKYADIILATKDWGEIKPNGLSSISHASQSIPELIAHPCKDGVIPKVKAEIKSPFRVFLESYVLPKKVEKSNKKTCFVQLGKYGDIINILPLVKRISDERSKRVSMVVCREFADVLSGVSYVTPHIVDVDRYDVASAISLAKPHYDEVLVSQIGGYAKEQIGDSFIRQSWAQAGYESLFGLPMEFDLRDRKREKKQLAEFFPHEPFVLFFGDGGSSPFQLKREALTAIQEASSIKVVDASEIRLARVYDLIGIMEMASLIVTIDTATLHLCHAVKTPSIQFISDTISQWHGSIPRGNCILSVRYKDVLRRVDEIKAAVKSVQPKRRIIHVYSDNTPSNENAKRRYDHAKSTWTHPSIIDFPIQDEMLDRMFRDSDRELPFVKDLLDMATIGLHPLDLVLITNRDVAFDAKLPIALEQFNGECGYLWRTDFNRLPAMFGGRKYDGNDGFVMAAGWWSANRDEFPDMLLGAEAWDGCLRSLMQSKNGCRDLGYLLRHEVHQNLWTDKISTRPSQVHNLSKLEASKFKSAFRHTSISSNKITNDDILNHFRSVVPVRKKPIIRFDHSETSLTTSVQGLGDLLMLSALGEHAKSNAWSVSPKWKDVSSLIGNVDNWALPKSVVIDHLYAKHDLGPGHFIQGIQRSFGFDVSPIPSAFVNKFTHNPTKKIALHFDPGPHAVWQRKHIHPRMRELYPETKAHIERMIKDMSEFSFVSIGSNPPKIRGASNAATSLVELAKLLSECDYFIGVPSGPMHLATAIGCKVICIINYPPCEKIVLPSLVHSGVDEEEWLYPQNVHLHQEQGSRFVPSVTADTLKAAIDGDVYPYWSHNYCNLICENRKD